MSEISRKKIILIIGLFALFFILVIILIFLRNNNTPREPSGINPTPTQIPAGTSTLDPYPQPTIMPAVELTQDASYPITFSLTSEPDFPKSVDIVESSHSLDDNLIQSFKNLFSFSSNPTTAQDTLIWTKENQQKSLLINQASGFVQYLNTSETENEDSERIFSQQAVGIANNLIVELSTEHAIPTANSVRGYDTFDVEQHTEEIQDLESASIYEITYVQSFKSIPVYYQLGTPATISVWVDLYGNIKKVEFFNLQLSSSRSISIKSLDTIIQETTQGKATTVKVGGITNTSIENIQSATITKISLGYLDDKTGPILYPVYILKGSVVVENETQEVTLYVPAAN